MVKIIGTRTVNSPDFEKEKEYSKDEFEEENVKEKEAEDGKRGKFN